MFDERQLARNGHRWQRNSKPRNNRIRSIFNLVLYRRFPIFACRANVCSWRRFSRLLEFFYLSCAQRQYRSFSFSCPPFQTDSSRYDAAASFVFTTNGVASSVVDRITTASNTISLAFASSSSPVVTDSDGLATIVIVALRSPPGPRTLQFFCGNFAGNATILLNVFINPLANIIVPVSPSPSSTPQVIGTPFTTQPSFQLCIGYTVLGLCIPAPGQVVVAVAESFVSDSSLDGNKMAQLAGFVSAKSDLSGMVTFTNLAVVGSSSQRVYFSFYAGGKAWSTWDGSPCSPGSASRCLSYVQLSGGPSVQTMSISPTPSVVLEGTVFPPIIVTASSSSAPIPNMVMYAQFSRIADAAAPKFTTPLKFGKKLLRAVAVTDQLGQARFNLSASIGGFAGAYDITFLPSVTTSMSVNLNLPVFSVLIATSVASVAFQGPSVVVRTLLKSNSTSQTFGYPIVTTLSDMQSTDYQTFFRLYFNVAQPSMLSPQFVVSASDAGSNLVPGKLVEMVSDPPNVLDLFADINSQFGALEPSLLPVILSATGSSILYLKVANPIPLAMWPRPPAQLYGINTARFYFVIDGVKTSSFVTVFLTPPVPPPPMPPSVWFNVGTITALFAVGFLPLEPGFLLQFCNVTAGAPGFTPPFNASTCAPSDTQTLLSDKFCVPNCPSSLSQLLPFWYQFYLPMFYFVLLPNPANPLSRVVARANVGAAPFAVQYGLTTFDGSQLPSARLAVFNAQLALKCFRASPIASSQTLTVVDQTSATRGLDSLSNNVYHTSAPPFALISNTTSWFADNTAVYQRLDIAGKGLFGYNFSIAPVYFVQSNTAAILAVQNAPVSLFLQIFHIYPV